MEITKFKPKRVRWWGDYTAKFTQGIPSFEDTFVNDSASYVDRRTQGENIPGWRQAIAYRRNATTTLNGEKLKLLRKPALVSVQYKLSGSDPNSIVTTQVCSGHVYNRRPSGINIPPGDLVLAENRAKVSFIKRLEEARSGFSGTTFLGELRETIHLIKHPAQAIRRGLDDYVRQSRRIFRRSGLRGYYTNEGNKQPFNRERHRREQRIVQRAIGDSWLEFQFGIKPLISDLKGAKASLDKLITDVPTRFVSSSRKEGTVTGVSVQPTEISIGYNSSCGWYYTDIEEYKVAFKFYGVLDLDVGGSRVNGAAQAFGLDWPTFIPTIWELLPYSFLVDYFTNIGDVIHALSFPSSQVRWSAKTAYQEMSRTATPTRKRDFGGSPDQEYKVLVYEPGWQIAALTSFQRETFNGSLIPSLVLSVPGVGSNKWLNIAALAGSRSVFTKRG